MRVSTYSTFLNGIRAIQNLQSSLDATQRQISSGRRIQTPSDDPIAASRALKLREILSRLGQFDRNAGNARNRLSQEEITLKSIGDIVQRVRELVLQANTATQNNETRRLIAIEMRENLNNLLQLANQKDGNGAYLFAGNLEATQPVAQVGSKFSYNGDQGQRFIQIGEGRYVADSDHGANVFFRIRNGNGVFSAAPSAVNTGTGLIGSRNVVDESLYDQDVYTVRFIDPANYEVLDSAGGVVTTSAYQSGDTVSFRGIEFNLTGEPAAGDEFVVSPSRFQDIFTTLEKITSALAQAVSDDASRAALANKVNSGLLDLDQALGKILDVRTQVGSRLRAIDDQVDNNGAFALAMQTTIAEIEDLDYAEAISRLTAESVTLQAAQRSFVFTQQLSLFDFL